MELILVKSMILFFKAGNLSPNGQGFTVEFAECKMKPGENLGSEIHSKNLPRPNLGV